MGTAERRPKGFIKSGAQEHEYSHSSHVKDALHTDPSERQMPATFSQPAVCLVFNQQYSHGRELVEQFLGEQ